MLEKKICTCSWERYDRSIAHCGALIDAYIRRCCALCAQCMCMCVCVCTTCVQVLSLLTLICSCVDTWDAATWAQFQSAFAVVSTAVYLVLYLLNLISRLPGPWPLIVRKGRPILIYYIQYVRRRQCRTYVTCSDQMNSNQRMFVSRQSDSKEAEQAQMEIQFFSCIRVGLTTGSIQVAKGWGAMTNRRQIFSLTTRMQLIDWRLA